MKRKKIGILTGGGDVQPLNSLISAVIEYGDQNDIDIYGVCKGWLGLIEDNFIELSGKSIDPLIGGTILKSSRVNLRKIDNIEEIISRTFTKNQLDGLIVIGGEDTLSNSLILKNIPQVLISKTIDNDVGTFNENGILNYFTLGYPTAAEKISSFVSLNEGIRTTAYSHERIVIVESMGMHAGWLALASSLGSPDFIIIPEFPLDYVSFKEKILKKYLDSRNVIVVVSEGSKWSDGSYISADFNEADNFGHPRFKGTAEVLANRIKNDLKKYFDTRNINSINPSYLYRSGKPNLLDITAAKKLGTEAVKLLGNKISESFFLAIQLNETGFSPMAFQLNNISNINSLHRFVIPELYDSKNYSVTGKGLNYLTRISERFPILNYSF